MIRRQFSGSAWSALVFHHWRRSNEAHPKHCALLSCHLMIIRQRLWNRLCSMPGGRHTATDSFMSFFFLIPITKRAKWSLIIVARCLLRMCIFLQLADVPLHAASHSSSAAHQAIFFRISLFPFSVSNCLLGVFPVFCEITNVQ